MPVLDDAILRLLVRFFRSGAEANAVVEAGWVKPEDVQYLRVHWALSRQMDSLTRHLVEKRHEVQATIESMQTDLSAQVRGRINATRTVLRRRLTGDPSQVSCVEPRKSFCDGPNYVLLWVLKYSHHLLSQYNGLLKGNEQYDQRVRQITMNLGKIHQMWGIGEALSNQSLSPRPAPIAVAQTGRSRRLLYRKAHAVFRLLVDVEHGEKSALRDMLAGALLGPLQEWQKYELLLALRIAETLARLCGERLELKPIVTGGNRPLATVGDYDVYWQSRTPLGGFPEPEPSEVIVQEILGSYGLRAGHDRPDVVVCNRRNNTVLMIAEAKYSTSKAAAWQDAFRDATTQLVRYSKLYEAVGDRDELLRRSLIAVSNMPTPNVQSAPTSSPTAVNFELLSSGSLEHWTARISHLIDSSLNSTSSSPQLFSS